MKYTRIRVPFTYAHCKLVHPEYDIFITSVLSGVYTSNFLNDLEFYLGQILSPYGAKSLGKYLTQIFRFIKGQYLAQIKIQIVKQIGSVDAALDAIHNSS